VDQAVSGTPFFLLIDDPSRIAECRRVASLVADREGLSPLVMANAALVASELASNLVKHAKQGEVHITPLSGRGGPGIEILSIDRGPGISNVNECLKDGRSTTGTSGTGLGAVRRVSHEFQISSQVNQGTIVVSQLRDMETPRGQFRIGLVSRPIFGETVSGDNWAVRFQDTSLIILVADGLGHGVLAADASRAAVDAFNRTVDPSPAGVVHSIHSALRGTRGAAVAVASVEIDDAKVRFAGLGNIAGTIVGSEKSQAMVSHNGTAGHEVRQIKEFVYPWSRESIIVMHSDGLSSSWNASAFPGFHRQHPAVMAALLYREAERKRDDACIIVGRQWSEEALR
jgi:anti-sigma regulatory factor (Ser/Thr protein kinase)